MSRNVFSRLPRGLLLVMTTVAVTGIAWKSASMSGMDWQPPPAVGDGLCSQACEVEACLRFWGTDADTERRCVSEAATRVGDLRRAGPDHMCVQRCFQHGSPVELSLLEGVPSRSLETQ